METARFYVMKQALELSTSAHEGMGYIQDKIREGKVEEAFAVLTDVVASFAEIQQAEPLLNLSPDSDVHQAGLLLQGSFLRYIEAYENRDQARLHEIMEHKVVPHFEDWYRCIRESLLPHVMM